MRKLHDLVTEIYKVKNNISPEVMRDIFLFQENENYKLRSGTYVASRNMATTLFAKKTVSNLEAKMLSPLPEELKKFFMVESF